ncbi:MULTISPECIES: TonB-dependent receptor [unclassified Polaribacter]|uniref:TonB-dependent receptor n=1 Tax=unclassified Polaribacter TaxID=196858 RepID=UPI0011BF3BDC|nr:MULTISPECIES: TonB-dependent receptor [unclassified Polaribacter]TXD53490.1 TonB-dependent receptor [Polaribacter sp. IC063]TXD57729.1 TonB-dependent receptor [Polaribacter sp. IC066]
MKQKNLLKFLVFSFMFTLPFALAAQTIKGKVTDSYGEGLPYINIVEKGTSNGTSTNDAGTFSIDIKSLPTSFVVSSMGFASQTIQVTDTSFLTIELKEDNALAEIVFIGSRNPNRSAIDSPVPIDIVNIKELAASSPQVNLNQILNFVAPSFTSNTQTISDGTDHVDPASLRGLGPDQVLVLINGKRRHTSSLINVNGTFGRGSVGTDLNAIPAAAIKRLEVLRDGAAAQYGSDAIAGVINIVLNESVNELSMAVTTGAHFSSNSNGQTGGVDGQTTNISASYGLPLGDKGGFINFSGDFDVREDYNRMKEWEGSIFNGYNAVERIANGANYDTTKFLSLSNGLDPSSPEYSTILNDLKGFATTAGYSSNATDGLSEMQSILEANATDSELAARGLDRADFNMRVGQSQVRGGRFFANFKLPLDDNGTELYSFAGMSSRAGNSAGFYRLPNQSRTFTPAYINGFLPEINSTISDQSLSVGIKGKIGDWNVDFSNTYGKNAFDYLIGNTYNASQGVASPTVFDAGGFSFSQNTTNLDLNRFFEDTFDGFGVAFGAEHRLENYEIVSGEESSYTQYQADGSPFRGLAGTTPLKDFFGNSRPGGSQVFPGFGPKNELARSRSSVAAYVDLDAKFSDTFSTTFATRYENYSDFGATLNFKLAAILKVSENFRVRSSFNTGFRAPSLHQLNFNSTSTIFQDGIPVEVGTFANDSKAAKLLGIPQLKEETSNSFSAGFTAQLPESNITFTVDGYVVNIADRVVYTGQFGVSDTDTNPNNNSGSELDKLLIQANASAASFFANAIDTQSKGVDVVITHKANFGSNTRLTTDLAGTFSQTRQVGGIKASQELTDAGLVGTYFPEDSRIFLEEAVPRTKVNLTNSLTTGKFNIFFRNVYFGEVSEATNSVANQQNFSAQIVTDLSLGYKATENLTLTVGANNLLDVYPDRAIEANRSGGRFDWSRRSQQFGVGGRFLFARVSFNLK